jgi:hypothetical protein
MFSRGGRSAGRHARDDRSRRGQSPQRQPLAEEAGVVGEAGVGEADVTGETGVTGEPAGPYDSTEAPTGVALIDLGSLKVPSVPGVEVRVQANPEGVVQQVYLVHGESALQLGVFAAPRTEPLWEEVRGEIRKQLFADGVAAEEVPGEYGTELRARVRTQQGLKDLRFVGVDGPRWMVRAVYQGRAATDPASAGPLTECLRGLVVDRGTDARPVKEPLPLRLSAELAERVQGQLTAAAGGSNGVAPGPAAASAGPPDGNGRLDGAPEGDDPPRRRPSPRPRRE